MTLLCTRSKILIDFIGSSQGAIQSDTIVPFNIMITWNNKNAFSSKFCCPKQIIKKGCGKSLRRSTLFENRCRTLFCNITGNKNQIRFPLTGQSEMLDAFDQSLEHDMPLIGI